MINIKFKMVDYSGNDLKIGDYIEIDSRKIGGKIIKGEIYFNTDNTLSKICLGLWNNNFIETDFTGKINLLRKGKK